VLRGGRPLPLSVSGHRALAATYIDSRAVQDRLDDVLGVDGWQDDYQCPPDGAVVCRLRCRISGEWLVKVDVGGPSARAAPGPGFFRFNGSRPCTPSARAACGRCSA
jgi:hypothetical protein